MRSSDTINSEATAGTVQQWSYTPFVVWRRTSLPFTELLPLALPQTWHVLDELQGALGRKNCEDLVDALHRTIPQAEAGERNRLLSLKRDIFSGRPPKSADVEVALRHLPQDALSLLDELLTACQKREELLLKAAATLECEAPRAIDTLKKLAARDDFVRGIQLSGRSLRQNVKAFSRTGAQLEVPSGLRKTRDTIVSYCSRMALKPSPFAAFTEVGAHLWSAGSNNTIAAAPPGRTSVSRLSRGILSWIQALMLNLEEHKETFPLWLNNTVEEHEDRVRFFTRGEDQGEQVFGGERLISSRLTPPLKLVIDELRRHKLNRQQLLQRFANAGIGPEEGKGFIEKLIKLGLLERGFGFADQEPHYLRRMVEFLSGMPGESSNRCVPILARLAEIEETFSGAAVESREKMLDEMDTLFRDLAFHLGSESSPDSEAMANLFEDYGSLAPSRCWRPSLLQNELSRFVFLGELLPVFDDASIQRAGLYEYYNSQFGSGREIDFLEFYQSFSALGPDQVSAIMRGLNTPYLAAVQELKKKFWAHISSRLNETVDASPLNLDDDYVRELIQQSPVSHAWESASFRLQFTAADTSSVVLNGIGPGYTSRFSRFCDLLRTDGNSSCLTAWVRDHFRASPGSGQRVDLSAVLNINTNLHPDIASIELEYPRSKANENVEVLTLSDLYVAPALEKKELRLHRKKDRRRLELVPLNFLHPIAGPPLYRFLHLFGPFVNYRHGLWMQYRASQAAPNGREHYPRLAFGPIALDRRTWVYNVKRLDRIEFNVDRISPASLLAVDNWRRGLGLPRECFFSLSPEERAGTQPGNWTQAVLEWTRRTKEMRRRKPHYVDFHNPFQTAILFKALSGMSGGMVSFQECLPATAEYLSGGSPCAEEFVIEVNRWPATGRPAREA